MKSPPLICHLMHGLRVGGAEVVVARLARRLRDRYRFCFTCLDELGTLGEELRSEGFPVDVAVDERDDAVRGECFTEPGFVSVSGHHPDGDPVGQRLGGRFVEGKRYVERPG